MSGCRIGKVRLKEGGAELLRFPNAPKDELQTKLVEHAVMISSNFEPGQLGGFVVIAWDLGGAWSSGFQITDDCIIGPTLAPSFVADALRRDLIHTGQWSN